MTEVTNFYKYVGAGNDFILLDNWNCDLFITSELVQEVCDRRFGVGADGVILIEPHEECDFRMVYFNADGSRGEMCGNGARCSVQFAHLLGRIGEAGLFAADDGNHEYVRHGEQIDVEIIVNGEIEDWDFPQAGCGFIDTGVPHVIMPVTSVKAVELDDLGSHLNTHAAHPQGTNLNIIQVSNESIKVRTWERGVNTETLACGTGAVAAAIFAHVKMQNKWPVQLNFPGGELEVDYRRNQYWLKGPAELVFQGILTSPKRHRN